MRIRLIVSYVLISFSFCIVSAQSVSVQWLKNSNGTSWDLVSDMVIDNQNNTYLACNYSGLSSRGKINSVGEKDIYLAKYNQEGDLLWYKQINSDHYCHISSLELDYQGKLLISGFYSNQIKLGSEMLKAEKAINVFFAIIDTNGEFSLIKSINGYFTGNKTFFCSSDSDSEYVFVGNYTGDIVVDNKNISGNNKSDIFIGRFSADGILKNHRILIGKGHDQVNDVYSSNSGDLYLTGRYEHELKCNNEIITSNGRSDAFLISFDSALALRTIKQLGGEYDDSGTNLTVDSENNLIWAGNFSGDCLFENKYELISNGNIDAFICKYNENNDLLWIDQFGGTGNDYLNTVETNTFGSIYISGSFNGKIEKDNSIIESVNSLSDVFLTKYSSDGEFKYMQAFGNVNADYSSKLIIDTANYIYLTGNFKDTFCAQSDSTKFADGCDFYLTRLFDCSFGTKLVLPGDTALCGSGYTIIADSNYLEYIWNNKAGGSELAIDTSNLYILEVKDSKKCVSRDSIVVNLNDYPVVDLGFDLSVFRGEVFNLIAPMGMENYKWNDSSSLSQLEVNTKYFREGVYTYSVVVKDTNSCIGNDEIRVTIIDLDNELQNNNELTANVFPNPAYDQFKLEIQNIDVNMEIEVGLFSLNGTHLLDLTPPANFSNIEMKIETQSLNAGNYLVFVKNGPVTRKVNVVIVK